MSSNELFSTSVSSRNHSSPQHPGTNQNTCITNQQNSSASLANPDRCGNYVRGERTPKFPPLVENMAEAKRWGRALQQTFWVGGSPRSHWTRSPSPLRNELIVRTLPGSRDQWKFRTTKATGLRSEMQSIDNGTPESIAHDVPRKSIAHEVIEQPRPQPVESFTLDEQRGSFALEYNEICSKSTAPPSERLNLAAEALRSIDNPPSTEVATKLVEESLKTFKKPQIGFAKALLHYGTYHKRMADVFMEEYEGLDKRSHERIDADSLVIKQQRAEIDELKKSFKVLQQSNAQKTDTLKREQKETSRLIKASLRCESALKKVQDERDKLLGRNNEVVSSFGDVVQKVVKLETALHRSLSFMIQQKELLETTPKQCGDLIQGANLDKVIEISQDTQQDLSRAISHVSIENTKLTKSKIQSRALETALRQEIKQQEAKTGNLIDGRNKLIHEKIRLQSQLKERCEVPIVQANVSVLQKEAETSKVHLQKACREAEESAKEFKKLNLKCDGLRRNSQALGKQLDIIQGDHEQSKQLVKKQQREITELKSENASLHAKSRETGIQAAKMKETVASQRTKLSEQAHEISDLNLRIKRHLADGTVSRSKIATLLVSNESLTGTADGEQIRGNIILRKFHAAETETKFLVDQVAALTKRLRDSDRGRPIFEDSTETLTNNEAELETCPCSRSTAELDCAEDGIELQQNRKMFRDFGRKVWNKAIQRHHRANAEQLIEDEVATLLDVDQDTQKNLPPFWTSFRRMHLSLRLHRFRARSNERQGLKSSEADA